MDIVSLKLSELHPYENNPRQNDDAVDAVAASIKEFGFKVPIVVDKNNVIVAGHTRYKAAQKLKLKTVPCVVADDLSEEQVNAFRLADNKTGELALWDEEKLAKELEGIANIDMEQFGFTLEDVDLSEGMIDDTYTTAVNVPQYEIQGELPAFDEMYDRGKEEKLIEEIEQSGVSDDEKKFLISAAHRHCRYNYTAIAEYYAHASSEMQMLMEKSALVIIDFDNALANGYVKLSKTIEEMLNAE